MTTRLTGTRVPINGTTKTKAKDERPKIRARALTVNPAFFCVNFDLNSVPSNSENQIAAKEFTPVETVLNKNKKKN